MRQQALCAASAGYRVGIWGAVLTAALGLSACGGVQAPKAASQQTEDKVLAVIGSKEILQSVQTATSGRESRVFPPTLPQRQYSITAHSLRQGPTVGGC